MEALWMSVGVIGVVVILRGWLAWQWTKPTPGAPVPEPYTASEELNERIKRELRSTPMGVRLAAYPALETFKVPVTITDLQRLQGLVDSGEASPPNPVSRNRPVGTDLDVSARDLVLLFPVEEGRN